MSELPPNVGLDSPVYVDILLYAFLVYSEEVHMTSISCYTDISLTKYTFMNMFIYICINIQSTEK